jgi:putative transposase
MRWFSIISWLGGTAGCWSGLISELLLQAREATGREPSPSAGVLTANRSKTTEAGGLRGLDVAKKIIKGRKRQLVTDTTGLPVGADVHRADIRDRDSAPLVTVAIHDLFPRLRHLFTVRAYAGERLRRALTKFGNSVTEIVPLMADTTGFKLLTRCWVATAFFSLAQSQSPLRKRFLRPP